MILDEFELIEDVKDEGLDYQIYERLCSECDCPLSLCDCSIPEQIGLFDEGISEKD